MRWYYADGGTQRGPVSEEEFQDLIRTGSIHAATLVWREGMANWQPLSAVMPAPAPQPVMAQPAAMPQAIEPQPSPQPYAQQPAVAAASYAPVAAGTSRYCSQCGTAHAEEDMVRFGDVWVCANCKQIYAQRLREGALPTAHRHFAGFWIRFAAAILDGIILWIFQLVIVLPLQLAASAAKVPSLSFLISLLSLAFGVCYESFFLVKYGATPGKLACQLRVIRADGGPITFGLAVGRYFGKMLSAFLLFIGFIMAGFDEEKRALHDRLCNTRVVYK